MPAVTFVSHGARLGVRASRPSVLDEVVARLPPGWRESRGSAVELMFSVRGDAPQLELYRGRRRVATAPTLEPLLAALESELHFAVATHARPHLFVHAGAVEWRGRGVLLPGRSRTGKSELVMALVAAGATYYSDEYAVLDARGWLHPYAKLPGVRRDGAKLRLDVPQRVGRGPVPVGAVAVTRFAESAAWRPRRITAGQAMAALLDNTVVARDRPRTAMATLACAAENVVALEGERGEADVVAGALLEASGACCGDGR